MSNSVSARTSVRAAFIYIILAVTLGGASDGFSKMLADRQEVGPLVFARYLPILLILLCLNRSDYTLRTLRTAQPTLQFLRAISPLLITVLMVTALRDMPLAEATVILFAGPFLVILLSGMFLGERIRPTSWIACALGFGAVLLAARPGFSDLSPSILLPVGAAICYALFQLLSRLLVARGESPETMLLWTVIVGASAALPFAWLHWSAPSAFDWLLLTMIGLTFGGCHYCFAQGFARAPASVLTPVTYFQVVAATAFGMLAFGDIPDFWTFAAIVMILAAGLLAFRSSR